MLRQRLIDSGWRDQLKAECKKVIQEQGVESITVEELVTQITPKGRGVCVRARARL
jgi:enhancer of yellow 2 transcription factor